LLKAVVVVVAVRLFAARSQLLILEQQRQLPLAQGARSELKALLALLVVMAGLVAPLLLVHGLRPMAAAVVRAGRYLLSLLAAVVLVVLAGLVVSALPLAAQADFLQPHQMEQAGRV
jgi:hypothetical protein